jgi:hypothetical protein
MAEGSPDDIMLQRVVAGLDFVKILRPGDTLPKEILTGEASWTITDTHLATARHSIRRSLVAWVNGIEKTSDWQPDPAELTARYDSAVDMTVAELDTPRDTVVAHIESLVHELAHIEALRDRFGAVLATAERITAIRRSARRGQELQITADSVARLMATAIVEFKDEFAMLEGQTGEIIAALKNIEMQQDYIRGVRDTLHRRLMAWDDTLCAWAAESDNRGPAVVELLAETYRFLAPLYMRTDDWLLVTQPRKVPDLEDIGERW